MPSVFRCNSISVFFASMVFFHFGSSIFFSLSVVDHVLLIVRESLGGFFVAESEVSTVESREEIDIVPFAFLDALLHVIKFASCNSFQGLCRFRMETGLGIGWFLVR